MYSFYNVTFQGLGCAAWVKEGFIFFFCWGWGFFGYFLKNSTINVGFGTHLRKTAQSTNIEGGRTIHTREKGREGMGRAQGRDERGEGSRGGILLPAQRGREGTPTRCRRVSPRHAQPAPPKAVGARGGRWETHLEGSHPQEEELRCAVVFQRLSAVKTLSRPHQGTHVGKEDGPGTKGTVSLLLP